MADEDENNLNNIDTDDQTPYAFKLFFFLGIQIVYLCYILLYWPHQEYLFNALEIFNELCLVALAYFMLLFSDAITFSDVMLELEMEDMLTMCSIGIIAFMIFVNLAIMVKLTISKLISKCRGKKSKPIVEVDDSTGKRKRSKSSKDKKKKREDSE